MTTLPARALAKDDLQFIRSQFPGLHQNFVYLDNAGGSQVLQRVADKVRDYLLTTSVQLGASYTTSQLAASKVSAARKHIAELINASHDEEVVMNGSTTSSIFLLTQALLPGIMAGDEIIVTDTDHESNIGGWKRLEQRGAIIKTWKVNHQSLQLELNDLDQLLSQRTKWLAMTHASNVLCTINPIEEAAKRVHAVGARLCVDGVAYAPHRLVDVQASGADVYVFSFYKVFGPHYAVMWGKRDFLLSLPSLNHYFIGNDVLPYKLQPGNVNFELSYGCTGINDYLVDVGTRFGATGNTRQRMQTAFDFFTQHEDFLADKLLRYLRAKSSVRIIGQDHISDNNRLPTISFVVQDKQSAEIVRHVDQYNIGIRFGDFYAKHLIAALDLQKFGGVVRVSIAHYNTPEEIDQLITAFDKIIT